MSTALGVGLAIGGGIFVYTGRKIKEESKNVLRDIHIIAESKDIGLIPSSPKNEFETEYVSFTGRLHAFDSPLLKSCINRRMNSDVFDAIRIKTKTYQRAEEQASRNVIVHTDTKISESESGGIVSVEPFSAPSTKVLIRDQTYFNRLYQAGEDEFKAAVESSISVFGEAPKSKTLGFRTVERLIRENQVVSSVGLVEGRNVPGATGSPKLEWVLVHPDHAKLLGRPSLIIYGDKEDLIRKRQKDAGLLDDIGDVVSVLGLIGMGIGGYYVFRGNSKR